MPHVRHYSLINNKEKLVLVSYIIPTYNSAHYLIDGLRSIYNTITDQSLFEVIVIDDESKDDTSERLNEFAKDKDNITLLHQKNQGQSVARNYGITVAKGKYIYFMDADDALSNEAYIPADVLSKDEYDIVGIEVSKVGLDGEIVPYCHQKHPFGVRYNTSADYLRSHNILGIVYGYYFRTEFVVKSGIRFIPGIYHQDEEFVARAFCVGGPMIYLNINNYLYYTRTGSSINTNTRERRERLMRDSLVVMKSLCSKKEYADILNYKLSYLTADMIRILIRQCHEVDFAMSIIEELRKMKRYPIPWISDFKLMLFKMITINPAFIRFWIKHPLKIF